MNEQVKIPGPCINFKAAVLARLMGEKYSRAYTGLGLTNEQVRMLLKLKGMGPVNQQGLANELRLEKSSFSRTIKVMIKKGLVLSKKDKGDSRQLLLSLSEKGEQMVAKIYPRWKEMHDSTTMLIGQAGIAELDRILSILLKS